MFQLLQHVVKSPGWNYCNVLNMLRYSGVSDNNAAASTLKKAAPYWEITLARMSRTDVGPSQMGAFEPLVDKQVCWQNLAFYTLAINCLK